MANQLVCEVVLANYVKCVQENLLELGLEEFRLHLSNAVELNECILKHGFIVLGRSCPYNTVHAGNEIDEWLCVFLLH